MIDGAMQIAKGAGCYFWTADGRKFLDFNSQAMCLSHGHTPDPSIVAAVTEQLETLPYAYPGISQTPVCFIATAFHRLFWQCCALL